MGTTDFLVIGGGVVGLTIALELRARHADASITLIEKESACGQHASGRNSGVIHAGFYYSADSLKARLCRDGNARLTAWCEEHGVPVRRCGKLVVAKTESELAGLDELLRRAEANQVPMEAISADDARAIEPRVRTVQRALWSPSTSAVNPKLVMAKLVEVARASEIDIRTSTTWTDHRGGRTFTNAGSFDAGYVVNAAGLHADRVARAHGFAQRHRMLPFKGLYLYGNDDAPPLATHIYPVPDLDMPFLGVHFTVTAGGKSKIGPTALPAWWLENYQGLDRFNARELGTTLLSSAQLFLRDPSFRRHATHEVKKAFRRELVRHASLLLEGVRLDDFDRWGPPGIRAQLFDMDNKELVMDFCFEGDDRSMHILNAVSPAFTCAFAFAELVVDALPS